METIMSILTGLLFAVGLYFMMQKSLLRVIIGASLIGHGSLLSVITLSGLNTGGPPILTGSDTTYTDPVPHALMLTAIVIGFGVTAFQVVLAYRTYQETGTD